jgi:hypothetical protein
MGILVLRLISIWLLLAVVVGFGVGAAIRRGEQIRKDEFLSYVFASIEALQASQS